MCTKRLFLFGALLVALATSVSADDFRIETKVYVADEPEPVSRNVTLFYNGLVYDFLSEPQQISIFRKVAATESGSLILLDTARKLRTDVTTEEILLYSRSLQDWATTQSDALLKFSANPDFQETFDEREGTLTMTSQRMTYRLLTAECSERASQQYKEFSDWYARAAARLHQGAMLPFPRLLVNSALARHRVIPREVQLHVAAHDGHAAQNLRSQHEVLFLLSKKDQQEIERAQQYLAEFTKVDLKTYQADVYRTAQE